MPLTRANPSTGVSLWRRAETVPERATQSLTFGGGAVIFSVLFLTDAQRYVPAAMYLIALLCVVTVLGVHNWRLRRKGGSQNAE